MAPKIWHQKHSIIRLLEKDPKRFDFFRAIWLMLEYARIDRAKIRLHIVPSLSFSASDIIKIHAEKDEWHIYTHLMGFVGADGVLPQHYTEHLLLQSHRKEYTFKNFLDIFQEKILWNLYDIWVKYKLYLSNEGKVFLKSLSGSYFKSVSQMLPFAEENLALYSRYLFTGTKNSNGLIYIVSTFFQIPTRIQEFILQTVALSEENCSTLPNKKNSQGCNCQLGINTLLGEHMRTRNNKIRIIIGPVSRTIFDCFTLNAKAPLILKKVITLYVGCMLDFDIEIILEAGAVGAAHLSQRRTATLGINSWCHQKGMRHTHKSIILPGEKKHDSNET